MHKQFLNVKCLIRTYSAGVHFGTVTECSEKLDQVVLTDSRRVHYWDGAASLSQMAVEGVNLPDNCRFAMVVPTLGLSNVIEILPLTEAANTNLQNVPVWKK